LIREKQACLGFELCTNQTKSWRVCTFMAFSCSFNK